MILYAVTAWLAADLVSGLVHWWEDRYGDPAWPVLGRYVVQPNIRHHEEPTLITLGGYWERNWTTMIPALTAAVIAEATGQHWLALTLLMTTQANEIHSWSHQRCSRGIRGLQLLGVLSSPQQHGEHHREPFATTYCTMTDWCNPVLEAAGAWRGLEAAVALFGVRPRVEREVA